MKRALRAAALIVCAWVMASWSFPIKAETPDLEAVEAQTVAVSGNQIGAKFW